MNEGHGAFATRRTLGFHGTKTKTALSTTLLACAPDPLPSGWGCGAQAPTGGVVLAPLVNAEKVANFYFAIVFCNILRKSARAPLLLC